MKRGSRCASTISGSSSPERGWIRAGGRLPAGIRPRRYNAGMASKEQLETDLKTAMRSGDDVRKRTLRMVLAAVKLVEVEKRGTLDEGDLLGVLQKEAKTRHESIAEAESAGRRDLVDATRAELEVIDGYLPAPLTAEELDRMIRQAVAATGASGPQDMGKVMKELMPSIQGRADGKTVSAAVREVLGSS